MTDMPPSVPTVVPEDAKYIYRVFLINGLWFDVKSIYSWPLFWHMARSEGHILTEKGVSPISAIASIADITSGVAPTMPQGGNVINFTPTGKPN